MLLDLWNLTLFFSDLADSIGGLFDTGLSFSVYAFAFLVLFLLIVYFAWLSTDITDLPSPPRPPYVIQIQANLNNSGGAAGAGGLASLRHTISDVRLLTSGPFADPVLHRLPSTTTNTTSSSSSATNNNAGVVGAGAGAVRTHHQTQHLQHTHGRRSALFFGLLRRPSSRPLLHFRPNVTSRFQTSNLIVYHQVNVYHTNNSNSLRQQAGQAGSNIINNNSLAPSETSSSSSGRGQATELGGDSSPEENSVELISSSELPIFEASPLSEIIQEDEDGSSSTTTPVHLVRSETGETLGTENEQDEEQEEEEDLELAEVDIESISVSEPNQGVGVDVHLNGDVTILEQNLSSAHPHHHHHHHHHHQHLSSSSVVQLENLNLNLNSNVVRMSDGSGATTCTDSSRSGSRVSSGSATKHGDSVSSAEPPNSADVRITLKFLNDTQMDVITQLSEKIVDFKRRHFSSELSQNKVVRLIFNGRVLDNDGKTLQEFGIFDQCVVHCLIVTPQSQREGGGGGGGGGGRSTERNRGDGMSSPAPRRSFRDGPEPGMFFVSVLGIVLIFLWFICFHFGQQLFTQSAVISLVVLTAVFVIGLVALYLPVQSNNT